MVIQSLSNLSMSRADLSHWSCRKNRLGLLLSTDSTAKQNSGRVEDLPLHASHLVNQFEDALAALVQISIARLLRTLYTVCMMMFLQHLYSLYLFCLFLGLHRLYRLTYTFYTKRSAQNSVRRFALMGLSMGEIICHGGLSQPGHEKEHGPKSDKLGEYVKIYIFH